MANKVPIRKALKVLANTSNATLFEEAVKNSPKVASYMAEGTQARLTKDGVEALTNVPGGLDEFYGTLLRVVFNKIDVARAVNGFEETGALEEWATPYGEYNQRMAVADVAPISPQYRGLVNGQSVDQYIVRIPELSERFIPLNYDYQNLITTKRVDAKRILLEEGQVGRVLAGIIEGMETGRVIQENLNVKYALNQGLNSTAHPLRDTQKYKVSWASDLDDVTDAQLTGLLVALSDIFGTMFAVDNPATGMFNAAGFKTRVEKNQYVLFMRTGIKNRINKKVLAGAFNPNYLNLDIDRVYDINDFGGMTAYAEADYTTQLYPIFKPLGDKSGYFIDATNAATAVSAGTLKENKATDPNSQEVVIGYTLASATTAASSIAGAVAEDSVYWKDGNANLIALIIQRGTLGKFTQNPLEVMPVPNYAGMYMNYWANQPNNGIYFDYWYNVIAIYGDTTSQV